MTTLKQITGQITKLLCGVAFLGMLTGTAYAAPILGSLEYGGIFFPELGTDGTGATTSLGTATYLDFFPSSGLDASTGDISTILGGPLTIGALTLFGFAIDPFIGTIGSPVTIWTQTAGGDLSFALTSLTITEQTVGEPDILKLTGSGVFSATGYDDTDGVWSLTAEDSGLDDPILTFSASTAVSEPSMLALLGLTLMGLGWTRRRKLGKTA